MQSLSYNRISHEYLLFLFLNETQKTFDGKRNYFSVKKWSEMKIVYENCEFQKVLFCPEKNKLVGVFFWRRIPNGKVVGQIIGCLEGFNTTHWQADMFCESFSCFGCDKLYSSVSKHKKNLKAYLRFLSLMWGAEIVEETRNDDSIWFFFDRQKLYHKLHGRNLLNDYRNNLLLESYK